MTMIPGNQPINRFTIDFRGSFGRFQTTGSHALHYLSTTLRISDIPRLSTASESFDIRRINFDELIQRDIDQERVGAIANTYLKDGQNRAIFFPPLLVCLAVLDEHNTLKPAYDTITRSKVEDNGFEVLRTDYDVDGFRLDLYAASAQQSERQIQWDESGPATPFFDYATKLSINPERTKLVVLDGQHRLEALKRLYNNPESRSVVANIEQPVCIVWMPGAHGNSGTQHIVQDLRDIFVTVNTEPKRVSGHFLILLSDRSHAALAVRVLADSWKSDYTNDWSRLHLLEWNTREDASTKNRQRSFSITTISILAEVLASHLFEVPGLAPALLRLSDRKNDFEQVNPSFDFASLRDDTKPIHGIAVESIVQQQIGEHLAPALDVLLRQLRPYADLETKLDAAFVALKKQANSGGGSGAFALRIYLNRFTYATKEMHEELAQSAWEAFRAGVRPAATDGVYFLSVFQQAYLRFWLLVARYLVEYGVTAKDAALATVAAAHTYAVSENRYLQEDRAYTRQLLWKDGSVNYESQRAKDAWTDILVSTLLRKDVQNALFSKLPEGALTPEQKASAAQRISNEAAKAARRYTSRLKDEVKKYVNKNLADLFGEVQAGVLRDLRATDEELYDKEIGPVVRLRFDEALDALAGALQQSREQLQPSE